MIKEMATQLGAIKRINNFKTINVDGFRFQTKDIKAYVLTHFHSDHTIGLSSAFKGPQKIYCSEITGKLCAELLKVREEFIVSCRLREEIEIVGTDFTVTFFCANHCPGAVMAYFYCKSTKKTVLHTGDFRADKERVQNDQFLISAIERRGRVDELYLDTTYCDKNYDFPEQRVALNYMKRVVFEHLREEPKTLFTCGSYSIGKERAFKAIGEAVKAFFKKEENKIAVTLKKKQMLELIGMYDKNVFTCFQDEPDDPTGIKAMQCHVRVVSHGGKDAHSAMNAILLSEKDRFKRVVAFSPSGWSWKSQMRKTYEQTKCLVCEPWVGNNGKTKVYHVPYSEHSSYGELVGFVEKIKPRQITPTVNADTAKDREKLLKNFEHCLDLSANKGKLEHYFSKKQKSDSINNKENDDKNNATTHGTVICLSSDDDDEIEEIEEIEVKETKKKKKREDEKEKSNPTTIVIDLSNEKNDEEEDDKNDDFLQFPLGCVCVVRNGEFKQFRNRSHCEQRLRELGAEVVTRKSAKVTHILCANGSMQATELKRLDKMMTTTRTTTTTTKEEEGKNDDDDDCASEAITVTESWLMRHVRASKNKTAIEPSATDIRSFEQKIAQKRELDIALKKDKKEQQLKKKKMTTTNASSPH